MQNKLISDLQQPPDTSFEKKLTKPDVWISYTSSNQ